MSWIDIAGAISAQRHSSRPVVTASIDALNFISPVYVGWVVCLHASVNYTARTSMEVGVRVDGENSITGEKKAIAHAYLTFVGLDNDGKPTPIPPLKLETDDEKQRFEEAEIRRQNRLELRKQIQAARQE